MCDKAGQVTAHLLHKCGSTVSTELAMAIHLVRQSKCLCSISLSHRVSSACHLHFHHSWGLAVATYAIVLLNLIHNGLHSDGIPSQGHPITTRLPEQL